MTAGLSPPAPRVDEHLVYRWLSSPWAVAPLKALFVTYFRHLLLGSTVKNVCKSQEFCVITQVSPATPALLSLFSSLTAFPSDFVSTGYSWCLLPQGCVCSWVKKWKELQAKGKPLVLPLPGSVPISLQVTCHLCGKEHDPSELPFRGHGKSSVLLKSSEMKNYFIYLFFNNFQSIMNQITCKIKINY